jgi:hypothetical protein
MPWQTRDTSDFEIPVSQPRAFTSRSTFWVDTPSIQAWQTTAHSVLSTRRRGSKSDGKNEPFRSFGMSTDASPAGVSIVFARRPFRRVMRRSVRSYGAAPIRAVASASMRSCRPA